MVSLAYEYDPNVWQPIPTGFPDEAGHSLDSWVAGQVVQAHKRGNFASDDRLDGYFRAVVTAAQQNAQPHSEAWLTVASDAPSVVMLFVGVTDADVALNDRLTEWTEDSASQYDPAMVTQLHSRGLGEGYQVIRNDIDPDDRSICTTLNLVFRVGAHDVIASTQSYDTAGLDATMPRIRELLDGVSVVTDAAGPVGAAAPR